MSSVLGTPAQVPANKMYVNFAVANSTITDANGNIMPWVNLSTVSAQLQTPGGAILRDMGKTVYGPDPNVPSALGVQSTIYRKVQLVTVAGNANGYYGTGTDSNQTYFTGYISLGAQTYGGGNGGAVGVGGTVPQPWLPLM